MRLGDRSSRQLPSWAWPQLQIYSEVAVTDVDDQVPLDTAGRHDVVDADGGPPLLGAGDRRRPARRAVTFAASGVVVVLIVVAGVIAARVSQPSGRGRARASALSALGGVTWSDPITKGTVVFTATAARTFDGCVGEQRALTLGAHTLDIGDLIGGVGACTGTPRPDPGPLRRAYDAQQAAVTKFDRVLMGHSTWTRTADTLRIVSPTAGSLALRRFGQAVSVTGNRWTLQRVSTSRDGELPGSFQAATLTIGADGAVRASDLCATLTGRATVTETTIDFGTLHSDGRPCHNNPSRAATAMIDSVLSGRTLSSIFNNQLILSGPGGELIYSPA